MKDSFCVFRHLITDPLRVVVSFDAITGWTLSRDDTNFSLAIRPRIAMRLIASLSRIMKVRAIGEARGQKFIKVYPAEIHHY